jgi:small conductance mechanosensitive channel
VNGRLRRGLAWREAGLARRLSRRAIKRARVQSLIGLPLMAGVLVLYSERDQVVGPEWDHEARVVTAVLLLALGWHLARNVGRALMPTLFRRVRPATAGTVDFLIRLATMLAAAVAAFRIAGLGTRTIAFGGAVTAVLVGLAAQQTLGHVFAGTVLLIARPFRVGERVRLQGGPLAGTVAGTVSSLGLLYTTLASDEGPVMVPNAAVLGSAVVPLREPQAVELRARLRPDVTPADLEDRLRRRIATRLRGRPRVTLEELNSDEVVVRIAAVPEDPVDGPRLAGEVLAAVEEEAARAAPAQPD